MGQEMILFKTKERKGREEVADFLHQLADKVATGSLTLKQGEEKVTLDLPENLIFEVKAQDKQKPKKGTRHQIEVELKWYDNQDDDSPLELE